MSKEGRGGRRAEEEGRVRRKEGQRKLINVKVANGNEKVAKRRIIGLTGPCF